MIRAYDEYGNVVDLVEWENQIRAETYQQGTREFAEWIHKYLGYSNDVLFTYRQSPVGFVVASKKSVDEIYAEWQKEKRMKLTQEEARLQDVVEIPDEYFELDHQRKELIDEVIRKLHESQKRGAK